MKYITGLLSAAVLALTSTVSWAETTNLLINSFLPPKHTINEKVLKPWAKEVYKATDGRVRVSIAPQSLAAPAAQLDAVTQGIADGAYMFHGLMARNVKLSQIAHLPFINSTSERSSIALWKTYEKFFAKVDEYEGVHVLSMFTFPVGPIYSMEEPITSIKDVQGKRVYALPGVAAQMMEAAGAGVVAVAAARSHEVISGGTVDAFAGYPVMDARAFNTASYAKSIVDVPGGITAASFAFFINQKKWDEISEQDQAAIMRLSGESFAARSSVYDQLERDVRAGLAKDGVQFIEADAAFNDELHKLGKPIVAAWVANAQSLGVDGDAALKYYIEQAQGSQPAK
ncbi:TRAP transporter substrate-binding protein DctP [Neopusillimonas maritima]|jgi:TRAP-type C4-dicarboxylate transport system substrate-binding protein|uniref:C4-dicarboxylate ABC transporter substrate-binding protein n=1 Tax=Neopusillimonas maritima TaxID=2026239 RepID=A0ABX9MX06_9BURK|nr:TRAP transporter substrate-binding protein DctP [Neopusillimonas maritima]RII83362.1 hypothetical protein CJO09_07125 [Neopusillimonas maritima]